MTFDEFTRDLKTQSAIQYQVLVIGEAAYRLTDPFLAATPDIPWRDIKQMRNVLAHAYDIIRLDIMWQTATASVLTPGYTGVMRQYARMARGRMTTRSDGCV